MHGTAQGTPVPLSSFGGLATIADPNSLPDGASPRTYDTDFDVGSVYTRDGLRNAYIYHNSSVGPNGGSNAFGAGWVNPTGILANDGSYASSINTGSIPLAVEGFAFNLAPSTAVTGALIQLTGFCSVPATATLQLLINGVQTGNMKTLQLPASNGTITFGSVSDSWGCALNAATVNNSLFGVEITINSGFTLATTYLDYVSIQLGVATGGSNFNWIGTFTDQDGTVRNLSQDAGGNLWVENATTNPGVLALALNGITPNSYCTGVNGEGVEYLTFSDLKTGSDVPRQYTSQWIDKITQVGPGAPPVFSSSSSATTTYPITNITQPAAKTWGFAFLLQSQGPGNNAAGNVVTVYYADSTIVAGPDADLVNAFNSGNAVYVYCAFTPSSGGDTVGALATPYTALVTSVNVGKPNGQSRPFYYFTFQVPGSGFVWNSGQNGAAVTYQRTLATLTTTVAVPGVTVGDSIVVTGNSVANWNTTWPVSQTPDSGSMVITQTALTSAGVGTYSYTVASGANPTAGQLVTITGTLNGNGQLNVANVPIASVTGTNTGTFTINLLPGGTNYPAQAEAGQAVTAGTQFDFDPGINTLATATSPIYGTGTGGTLTVEGGQVVSAGTRQGVVGFITRNGYWTAPSPPITFDVPANTTTINAANIPLGPPNTIGRYISFTEAGQNNVPGANFFVIPTPVQYVASDITYTATATIIWDNITTQASFTFVDDVLLNAEAIDVQGNNLFNLIEIGNPGWIVQYDSRNFYGLCQNKVQNFNNLSFDGGYLNPASPTPLGWNLADQYGSLLVSPVFGNSYYVKNTSGAPIGGGIGIISQPAYQDAYLTAIIQPNTTYSVRVTCRCPGGVTTGSLVIGLTPDGGGTFGVGVVDMQLSAMTSQMATYTFPLLTVPYSTVPTTLRLMSYLQNPAVNADVEIDRIEVFPTQIPVLTTTVYGSYANDFESVDAVTGQVKFISENQQQVNGAVVMYDTFYGLKDSSMYSLKSSPNLEPAQWDEPEVAQRAGACGILAYDFGEQWIISACRNGLYLYEGGQPGRIMPEIYQVWNAINWTAKDCIWVKNDVPNSRLLIGIPLPTPNFWLPNAPKNTNPTTPNVMLVCNYKGVTSGEGVKAESAVHVTMFGTLEAGDMRRKWTLWNIKSPYGSFVQTATDTEFYICNGVGNSKIYHLDPTATTDDGAPINSLYTTAGMINASKSAQMPALGWNRRRWGYMTLTMENQQLVNCRFLPNSLLGPTDSTTGYYPWTVPGGFSPMSPITRDRECTVNFGATRTYLEFSGTNFDLSGVMLYGKKDTWNAVTGQK